MKISFSSIKEFFIKPNKTTLEVEAPITEKTKESAINLKNQFENINISHKINEINENDPALSNNIFDVSKKVTIRN
jgi:hypothetical protein